MNPHFGLSLFQAQPLAKTNSTGVEASPTISKTPQGRVLSVPLLIGDDTKTLKILVRELDITSSCCKCPKEQ